MLSTPSIRVKRLIFFYLAVIFLGIGYSRFILWTNIAIPCQFTKYSGLQCPGCGVTRMCLALLRLDFTAAFGYNPVIFCLLPVFGILFGRMSVSYVEKGKWEEEKLDKLLIMGIILLLVIWTFWRNVLSS